MKSPMSIKKTFDNEFLTMDEMEPQKANNEVIEDKIEKLDLKININYQIYNYVVCPCIGQFMKHLNQQKQVKNNEILS